MLAFNGEIKTRAGEKLQDVHGHIERVGEPSIAQFRGTFRIAGVNFAGLMASDEYQLDIPDGPSIIINVQRVADGTASFLSSGPPLRDSNLY